MARKRLAKKISNCCNTCVCTIFKHAMKGNTYQIFLTGADQPFRPETNISRLTFISYHPETCGVTLSYTSATSGIPRIVMVDCRHLFAVVSNPTST